MSPPSKPELRRALIRARATLPPPERRAADEAIWRRLRELRLFRDARSVAAYAALPTEVQTAPILAELCATHGGVALPVTVDGAPALAWCEDPAELVAGEHKVLSPRQPWSLVDPATIDCLVLPGVGFDRTGARLGRGKGFYDRLLPAVLGTRIGLAYAVQVVERIPVEPHDARVGVIVTEAEVIHARAA